MKPTDPTRMRIARAARTAWMALAMMLLGAAAALASLPAQKMPAPRSIAPVDGALIYESGVRFAWQAPAGAAKHYLVLSREPFETRGWTQVPDGQGFQVFETAQPVVSLNELGVTIDGNARLYWAAGSGFAGKGEVSFSEVRSNIVRRKFVNRVQPSPHLAELGVSRAAPQTSREGYRLHLGAGYTIDPSAGDPAMPAALRTTASAVAAPRTFLVAYGDADPNEARRRILEAGGSIVSYVPDRAFLVRMSGIGVTPEGDDGRVQLRAAGEWVGTFHPAYKLSPRLELGSAQPSFTDVLVFQDGDLQAVRQRIEALGASVLATSDNGINKILRIVATGADVQSLAHQADVAWIEPYVQPEMYNSEAQWVVQTDVNNSRRLWDEGLKGEGQVVMTSDSGINMLHHQFKDAGLAITGFGDYPTHRKVIAYQKGSDNPDVAFGDHGSYHGSHTAGSAAGNDDPNSTSTRDGVAKEAKLWHMDISGAALGAGVVPFLDLNDLFQPSYDGNAAGAARLSSNSWGASLAGAYNLNSLQVDQFMWNNKDYLIVFANGNEATVGSVGSPATSKSCIGAGGTGNGSQANLLYFSTSKGPTADGRQKPTICSPGQAVVSSISSVSSYASYSGTSMASPTMTGAIALIRQYVTEGWYPTGAKVPGNAFEPSAALLKAMAVNSAANDVTGNNAPNNNIGYGRILADDVCYFAGDAKRLLLVDHTEGLGHLDQIEYQINVTTAGQPLEVTLCWTDYPGSPLASIQLVNDLNLEVISPGGVSTYLGNRYNFGFSITGGSADDRDVEEAVLLASADAGIWTVRVIGLNIPLGPQPFGLAMTGAVGTDAGTIALDRATYGSTSTVEIQVTDTNAGATVDVGIVSTTEPGGETVTLAQTGSGIYTGSIPLSPLAGAGGDNVLQVSHGDLISASYDDGAPSLLIALTADASVSLAQPLITNVNVAGQGAGAVRVTWDTDINATSQVEYGTMPGLGTTTALDPTAALSHSVLIEGLANGQTYYFDVESQSLNGNLVRDDNGGNHYQFSVSGGADILIVQGGDFDTDRWNRYTDALDANGWIYDVWNAGQHNTPLVGNTSSGMRAYKAVWWQVGLENYPPYSDAARDSITAYLDGGGRFVTVGHDIVWSFGDFTSSFYSAARAAWLSGTLHTSYASDPPGWTSIGGVVSDPISGAYTGTLSYTEHRSGASGDEVNLIAGAGTVSGSWLSGDGSPDDAGLRWESNTTLGTPGLGFWGGEKTRLATMYFEWSGLENFSHPTSAARTDILDKTLIWLLGHDKPDAVVTTPNGGETFVTGSENITWSETTYGGTNPGTRKIEFSPDGGLSWVLVTADAGAPPPYAWDLSSVSNTPLALVRVTLTDDGTPAFSSVDQSDATFTINRPGGDGLGPVVVAGSIVSSPNPINNQSAATLTSTVSDLTTGGSNIMAAEWSFGAVPAHPGTGTAMTGAFGTPSVAVSAALTTSEFTLGAKKLWVRGQDSAGNWGSAQALSLIINGVQPLSVGDQPREFELWQNVPNPVVHRTMISYAVPVEAPVELSIFDVQGRVLRKLVRGNVGPGIHQVMWDGADDRGRPVGAGIYYYRFTSGDRTFERRLVTLR